MCFDRETKEKLNNNTSILDEILSIQKFLEDRTLVGYDGIVEKVHSSITFLFENNKIHFRRGLMYFQNELASGMNILSVIKINIVHSDA